MVTRGGRVISRACLQERHLICLERIYLFWMFNGLCYALLYYQHKCPCVATEKNVVCRLKKIDMCPSESPPGSHDGINTLAPTHQRGACQCLEGKHYQLCISHERSINSSAKKHLLFHNLEHYYLAQGFSRATSRVSAIQLRHADSY